MALTEKETAALQELALKVSADAEFRKTFIANPRQIIDAHAPDISEEAKASIANNAEKIAGMVQDVDDVSDRAAVFAQFA